MARQAAFSSARASFHAALLAGPLSIEKSGVPTNADKDNKISVALAKGIAQKLNAISQGIRLAGQTSGDKFEDACAEFLASTFPKLSHLRPGRWEIRKVVGKNRLEIALFEQYAHLVALDKAAKRDPELAAALGSDYTITPDVVISREPEPDSSINAGSGLVDGLTALHASLRKQNGGKSLLHASISCKWTIRSDRAQNARTEALNLIRNRKGHLPHVVVVTAEPLPSRLASLALGTGDIDCVYHFALYELQQTLVELDYPDASDMLSVMIEGRRLRDISDLPLDLAI